MLLNEASGYFSFIYFIFFLKVGLPLSITAGQLEGHLVKLGIDCDGVEESLFIKLDGIGKSKESKRK